MTRPAYSSACKLCHWYSACIERLKATDDLTLIPELGRPKRDAMLTHLQTVAELADCNPDWLHRRQEDRVHGHRTRHAARNSMRGQSC